MQQPTRLLQPLNLASCFADFISFEASCLPRDLHSVVQSIFGVSIRQVLSQLGIALFVIEILDGVTLNLAVVDLAVGFELLPDLAACLLNFFFSFRIH